MATNQGFGCHQEGLILNDCLGLNCESNWIRIQVLSVFVVFINKDKH